MTQFGRGDRVVDPEDPTKIAVIVDGPVVVAGTRFYVLLTASQEEAMLPESELKRKEVDRQSPASWLIDRPLVDPFSLSRALTHLKLTSALTDIVYSFSAARTLFRPHQFKPVLKVIESPVHRLLLADEVGLGKTIEAGLIWTELDARAPLRRVLIVAPSGLLAKWQFEMEGRFDRETRVLTSKDFVQFADRYADRGDSTRLAGVMSYAQLRNEAVIEVLSTRPPTFDLAIFDEAHALRNPSTRTHEAARLIADNTEALMFLSATPVNLGSDDLFNLLHLLRPDEFSRRELFADEIAPNEHINAALRVLTIEFPPRPDLVLSALREVETTAQRDAFGRNPIYRHVVSRLQSERILSREQVVDLQREISRLHTLAEVYVRTRKRDLPDQQIVRRASHLKVQLTDAEQGLYDATLALVRVLRQRAIGAAPGLAAVMPARQASSCLPVMREYLEDLAERGSVSLDLSEGEEEDDLEGEVQWRSSQLALDDHASALAAEIRLQWQALGGNDSKFETLASALREFEGSGGRRRVLLFSFFRLTLAYLDKQLTALGYRCAQMHGGTPIRERTGLIDRFRSGEIEVLLCSEVGSEGLDFQFCDVLVNYDLPWNPMRLEQRIGRLDRFGQLHPVINILNFAIDGTIDTDIFLRLYRRIEIFEQSIGELEPILGTTVRELTRELAHIELTHIEQEELADRMALAVEAEQSRVRDFDEEQDRLVGADAFVDDRLRDAREQRRYLTPEELARYVEGFITEAAHPARLRALPDTGGLYALQGSPLLAEQLRECGRDLLSPSFSDVITRVEAGTMTVTFDAERAYDASAEFLSHRHPIVRSISNYYRPPERSLHPGGFARLQAEHADHAGRWIFYVFLLSATGLLPQRSLVAVAARLDDGRVEPAVGEAVLSWLSGPGATRIREQDIPLFDRSAALRCYDAVLEHVAAAREDMKVRLAERNDALITVRQESLRRELEARRARLREMADRPDVDDRIRRMRVGQIANLEDDINARIRRLDEQRELSVRFNVVLGGLAELLVPKK